MPGSEGLPSNTGPLPEQVAQVAQEPTSGTADVGAMPVESQSAHEETSNGTEAADGTPEIKEVSVGDLERELEALGAYVSALAASLVLVFDLRQAAITHGLAFSATELARLAQKTTEVSAQLATLPATFTLTGQRLLRLESLVALDKIAALASELGTLREQFAAARLEARQTIVERIRSEAWDEVDARESAWIRCEERIAAENPALNEQEVRRAVAAAFEGASDGKVATLDITSYAGRLAAENPATELAQILDDHADAFRAAFSDLDALSLDRQTTRNSTATGTTLVDPGAAYEKAGQDEDGKSGLQRLPTSATLVPGLRVQDEELGLLGTAAAPEQQAHAQPLGRLGKLRMYWRDYLVRTFLLISILALIAGLAASQILTRQDQGSADAASTSGWTAFPDNS